MLIHLASAGLPRERSCIPAFEDLAENGERHQLTDSADEADVVLFTELHLLSHDSFLRSIRRTEAYRRNRQQVLVYDESDRPWGALPGLYVSMPRSQFRSALHVAWPYYTIGDSPVLYGVPSSVEPDLLFSFVGSPSHPVRDNIFQLEHSRAIVERVDGFTFFDAASARFGQRRARFAELMMRSIFVLCPRGSGTSSIRAYETMAAGRVPVIISDDWVEPLGINWSDFAVLWPERGIKDLPRHLESLEERAAIMGKLARKAYEENLQASVMFDRIGDACVDLLATQPWSARRSALLVDRQFTARTGRQIRARARHRLINVVRGMRRVGDRIRSR